MVEIIIAFGLDQILGDPPYPWHPARLIGRLIERSEAWLRARLKTHLGLAGFIQALFVSLVTFLSVWFLCELAFQIHPLLKKLFTIYFIYSAVAVKDLESEAKRVYACLTQGKLEEARKNLARIVGRDTGNLSEEEVTRGAVEAVAESYVDGILSPLFFAALGGAPLAMAYKAVNTLDSMVGLRTPRYREFGATAAKLDELANWIPARLSWLLIGLGAFFVNGRAQEAWYTGLRDGTGVSRPNSAAPEAAFAGALGVELGGINYYQGQKVETPKLGYPMKSLQKEDVRKAYHLMRVSAWAALIFAVILSYLPDLFFAWIFHPL